MNSKVVQPQNLHANLHAKNSFFRLFDCIFTDIYTLSTLKGFKRCQSGNLHNLPKHPFLLEFSTELTFLVLRIFITCQLSRGSVQKCSLAPCTNNQKHKGRSIVYLTNHTPTPALAPPSRLRPLVRMTLEVHLCLALPAQMQTLLYSIALSFSPNKTNTQTQNDKRPLSVHTAHTLHVSHSIA